jgi:NADH dehydrogenase
LNAVKRALILGGTGFVGRHLCEALQQHDVHITVVTRRLPARSVQMLPRVQVMQADVLNASTLAALVMGHDVVINLVAILHGTASEFQRVHVDLVRSLANACVRGGVQRLVHVSALGADEHGPSEYQRSKGRGEAALLQVAASTGLTMRVLRPSVIFGHDDQFINTFARLQRLAPMVPLAGAHTRFQPVWVQDVAQALVALMNDTPSGPITYEAAGPDVLTLADLVHHAGRWAHCERPVLPLPLSIGRLQAWLMEALPGKPLMSRDNVDSMRVDNVAHGDLPGLAQLSIAPRSLGSVFTLA